MGFDSAFKGLNIFTDVRFTEAGGTWKIESPYIRPTGHWRIGFGP